MNEFKGTPGPWRVSESRTSGFCVVREGSSDGAVVGCQDEYDHYGAVFKKEDAHIIAAAPDLLDCCTDFLRLTGPEANSLPLGFGAELLKRVKSAVDKATSISN